MSATRAALFAALLSGCVAGNPETGVPEPGESASAGERMRSDPGPPESCPAGPDLDAWRLVVRQAGEAVRELMVCANAQIKLARSLFVQVFVGNQQVFGYDPATLKEVRSKLGVYEPGAPFPFAPLGDGAWRMKGAPVLAKVDFDVRFHDPQGKPVTADPFQLDTYLQGVTVTYAMTFAEMKAKPTEPNTYTIAWKQLGPLGHLLAGPRGGVPNPIVLHISAYDFLKASEGKGNVLAFGPFGRLLDVGMSSHVAYQTKANDIVQVNLEAAAPRAALREAAVDTFVDFEVRRLDAYRLGPEVLLVAAPAKVGFAAGGGLTGSIPVKLRSAHDEIAFTMTFSGFAPPGVNWGCGAVWPPQTTWKD